MDNRFDDIWKDRFNEEQLPVDDWNTPDDEVWKGILPHVTPKKEKKRRWWWLWFGWGSALVLMTVVFTLFDNNKNTISAVEEVEENEVANTRNSISSTHDSNVVSTGINLSNSKSPVVEIESKNMSVNISPSKANEIKNYNNKNVEPYKSSHINLDVPISKTIITDTRNDVKSVSPETSSSFKIFKNKKALKPSLDGKNEMSEKLSISNLSSLEILLQKRNLPIHDLPDLKWSDIDIVPPSYGKIAIGFSTGAVFWKHRISENYTTLLSPFDFNYKDALGWQAALDVKFEISDFLEGTIGFQYEQINTESGHNSDITYSIDDEEDVNNPLNGYALSLATPYGLSGATFNFIRNQDIGANSADLTVDFHSSHVIKNISIPVGLNIFPFGKKNKWIPSAHIEFGTNYLASISNNIQSIETHHDAIQFDDSGTSTFVSPELEKWHFDYRLGLGVTYHLNSKSSLRFNYNWSRGINPIFQQEDFNTRIDRHHLSVGLTTKLRKP